VDVAASIVAKGVSHGDKALWLAVIDRCWRDCFSDISDTNPHECRDARDDARKFLLSVTGKWAKSRDIVCSLVDIDPDALHESALARRAVELDAGPRRRLAHRLAKVSSKAVAAPSSDCKSGYR
jgi:hypothetical protein